MSKGPYEMNKGRQAPFTKGQRAKGPYNDREVGEPTAGQQKAKTC